MAQRWKVLLGVAIVATAAAITLNWSAAEEPALDPAQVRAGLPRRVATLLAGESTLDPRGEGLVYVALRAGGLRVSEAWASGPSWRHGAVAAVERALSEDPGREADIDTIELCVPYDYRYRSVPPRGAILSNVHRGVEGIALSHAGKTTRYCPTSMVARNQSFGTVEREFRRERKLDKATYRDEASAERFFAHQLLLKLQAAGPDTQPMHRGNTLVPMSAVTSKGVKALAQGMGDWMINQLEPSGRMLYRYFPSNGRQSNGNNMIRQYMASICFVRLAAWREDQELMERAKSNLLYNFSKFYRQDGDIGLITFRGRSKLGAAALAALGIVEAPFREDLSQYEIPLRRMTEAMLQEDGHFITFYGTQSVDNSNFYPGETLLLWATIYQKQPDPALLERFMRAFRYYRTWHKEHLNPAFIPWHVQAYYRMWQKTKSDDLVDAIFDMSDWLVDFQEWDAAVYKDTRGRFYDDRRRQFGVPHASSTGVYLEGLIDSYKLAKALGDQGRADSYRTAIKRGLRSLMQLQFVDDVDMYYVTKRKRVGGGIRTTVYDNSIRVDNVQHGLMAIMRIIDEFDADNSW